MTPQQIVGLAVRLVSVYLIFLSLQLFGSGVSVNNQPGIQPSYAYFYAATFAVFLAVGLWFFPMFVAHRLLPRTKYENVLRVPAAEAAMVGCVITGLWLFSFHVLPAVAHYVSLAVALKVQGQPVSASDEFTILRLGPVVVELFFVWLLCFKAHSVARFFTTERTARLEEE